MIVALVWTGHYVGWERTCRFGAAWSSDDTPWPPTTFHVDGTTGVFECEPPPP